MLNILQENGDQNKSINKHIARAKEICNFPETDRLKIAVLGCAGVGKSSLLNAVTSIPGLAKSVMLTSFFRLASVANVF
jgi:GTP-binding protein EngB required for normal cell division